MPAKKKHYMLEKKLNPTTGYQHYIVVIRGKVPAESPAAAKALIFEHAETLASQLPGAEYLKVSQPKKRL